MEKIYMEESQKQSSKKQSIFNKKLSSSVVLSFMVAFFAIFSLIACGITQISYAAPTDGSGTSVAELSEFKFTQGRYNVNARGAGGAFRSVPTFYASDITSGALIRSIFCIEPSVQPDVNNTYQRDDAAGHEITDYGLLSLLDQFYNADGSDKTLDQMLGTSVTVLPTGYSGTLTEAEAKVILSSYIKQASVWAYITGTNSLSDSERAALLGATNLNIMDTQSTDPNDPGIAVNNPSVYNAKINELVSEASSATSYTLFTLNQDSIVQSPSADDRKNGDPYDSIVKYSINTNKEIIGYNVVIKQVTEGGQEEDVDSSKVYLVDSEGHKIENTSITANNFNVFVSRDLIKLGESDNEAKSFQFKVYVEAQFRALSGKKFVAVSNPDGRQKVVTVTGSTKTENDLDAFTLTIAPDTGMTTAQSIYFIGLVVLLCGVGIVYANSKPAESKQ